METQYIMELIVLFGIGLFGFVLNIVEWFIDYVSNGTTDIGNEIGKLDAFLIIFTFLIICICPPFGWIITFATIIRQLNYIFHFYKIDDF